MQREWAPVIAKSWGDDEFKELLENDPAAAFSQFGLTYDGPVPFAVPARPRSLDMSNVHSYKVSSGIRAGRGEGPTSNCMS